MRGINAFQKLLIGIGAVTIGLRLFFPVTRQAPYGPVSDVATTVLQLAGLVVVFAALFYLTSAADIHRVRRFLLVGLVLLVWSAFLVAVGIGIRRLGIATSFQTIHWAWTGGALAAFVLLIWISWLAFRRETPSPARSLRLNLAALSVAGILLVGGYLGHIYQGKREAAPRGVDFEKELDSLRYGIVEGQRIGPVQLGMSLDEVNGLIGRRFSSGRRLSNDMTSYIWRPLDNGTAFWNVFFDSKTNKAVIIAYGFNIERPPKSPPSGWVLLQPEIERSRFQTVRGVRFGDSRATVEALYGKPSLVTPLRDRKDAVNLRLHYESIRTEFQFDESGYGLLSILTYAPGFSPESTLRAR